MASAVPAQIQLLHPGGGDGAILHMDGIGHIGLGALPGDEVLLGAGLPGHFVDQGDALGLGGEEVVVLLILHQLQQVTGAGHRQLRITETDECTDIQIIRNLADGKFPLQARHGHGIGHL